MPFFVRRMERRRNATHDVDQQIGRDAMIFAKHVFEALAIEQLHHEVVLPRAVNADVEDVNDVVVANRIHRLRLSDETRNDFRIFRELQVEHLDRRALADQRVLRPVDGTEAALTEWAPRGRTHPPWSPARSSGSVRSRLSDASALAGSLMKGEFIIGQHERIGRQTLSQGKRKAIRACSRVQVCNSRRGAQIVNSSEMVTREPEGRR